MINKILGYTIDEILEHIRPYVEDEYTGTDTYLYEDVYKMHLSLDGYNDTDENRNIFHKRMMYHKFQPKISFI